MRWRLWVLIGAIAIAAGVLFFFPAIPQSEAYHNFADKRALLGIPNCFDVISNFAFLIVGVWGLVVVWRQAEFADARERWPYVAFFVGVTLTAFGSSWYHLNPNDATLVWDRIPMTIGFLGLVAALLAERVSVRIGLWLLAPLIALGVASVIYWEITQHQGHGDLRPYVFAQFGSLLILILLIFLFPARYTRTYDLGISLGLYALAKLLEAADRPIYTALRFVSGHTLKHLAAALSAYWIVRMLRLRREAVGTQRTSAVPSLLVLLAVCSLLALPSSAQTYPQGYINDNSDWWSAFTQPSSGPVKSSSSRFPASTFRILGVTLNYEDVFEKATNTLGKGDIVSRGDASTGRKQECYMSDGDSPKTYLIFETGELDLTFYLFTGGPSWSGMEHCVSSDLVSPSLKTGLGLYLGMTRDQAEAILGKPQVSKPDRIAYSALTTERTPPADLEKSRKIHPEMSEEDIKENFGTFNRSAYVEVRFKNSKAIYLAVSTSETD
jgi:hypothetical protein